MTRPLLVVLNPRRITECMEAFDALHIDVAYLRNYTETQIADEAWPLMLEQAPWADPICVVSDDALVSQRALSTVLGLWAVYSGACVTGWCQLADDVPHLANLCTNELQPGPPHPEFYDFMDTGEIREHPEVFHTTFTGMALTTMRREMWTQFPFGVYGRPGPGYASDYHLSHRLGVCGVEILSHRDAEIGHVKTVWNHNDQTPGRELLIGKEPAEIVFTDPPLRRS